MLKVAGAITFKNYVKRNWKVGEEGPDKIHASDRNQAWAHMIFLNHHPLFTIIQIDLGPPPPQFLGGYEIVLQLIRGYLDKNVGEIHKKSLIFCYFLPFFSLFPFFNFSPKQEQNGKYILLNQVKSLIVDLMLTSPLPVQKQLSQAIAIIGKFEN